MKLFIALILSFSLCASEWNNWIESQNNPIYNPVAISDSEDYFPYIIHNQNKFDGNGSANSYKMWHQGANPSGSIALSHSNDGIHWTLQGETNLASAYHPVVLYDKHGFGTHGKPYRMWFWTGQASTTDVGVIQFTQSNDGMTWDAPQPIMQNPTAPLLDNTTLFFTQLHGPGFIFHHPKPTSVQGEPHTFRFVMYYDIATSAEQQQTESIALAYSNDGILWSRFGTQPVLIASGNTGTDWDATHLFRPSIIKSQGKYHMFYCGSNQFEQPDNPFFYAHGIGHASSSDGINWVKESGNPIFHNTDGVAWRNTRTYTPFVLEGGPPGTLAKMWFVGGTEGIAGQNQGIGYATLPVLKLPTITKITPNRGPSRGGNTVTISGKNFEKVSSVMFGSKRAAKFKITSATQITAVVPPHLPGKVSVSVVAPNGASESADYFYLLR